MLQQTTVAAVQPYFRRFLESFPDVATLAASDEAEVLRLWQGLGYYSRARNLRAAARRVVEEFGGAFPETVDELVSLPGIGRYTAGAIVSFAFDRPAPIVEANTLRLYARLLGYERDPRDSAGTELLWTFAERVLPAKGAGAFNQALMELGSQVCRPTSPDCPACPLKTECRAFELGLQSRIPPAKKRPQFEDVVEHSVVVRRSRRGNPERGPFEYLLLQWQPGERWAGLWDFVRFGAAQTGGEDSVDVATAVHAMTAVTVRMGQPFHELRHGVTRFRIRLVCHAAEYVSGTALSGKREFAWVTGREFAEYPLSTSARKVANKVRERESGLFADD